MLILGIDPGRTTGLCFVSTSLNRVVLAGEVTSIIDLHNFINQLPPGVIVIEDFQGGGMRNARDPLKVIGAVELICTLRGIPLVLESPSVLQQKEYRLSNPVNFPGSKSIHVRSAHAHARHYIDTRR